MPDPKSVRAMFGRIAGRYDLLNRVLSAGIDRRWRRRVVRTAGPLVGRRAVDLCCGTGDLSLELARSGARVVGVDFTPEMVAHARRKGDAPLFAVGDGLQLPVASGAVDLATVAFGIRNVADRHACLREMARVLRPGGQVLVLEFSMPSRAWLGFIYRFYFTRVLPLVGALISGDRAAYRYLPDTVLAWPRAEAFRQEFEAAGFVDCAFEELTGGIACLHTGRKPGHRTSDVPGGGT